MRKLVFLWLLMPLFSSCENDDENLIDNLQNAIIGSWKGSFSPLNIGDVYKKEEILTFYEEGKTNFKFIALSKDNVVLGSQELNGTYTVDSNNKVITVVNVLQGTELRPHEIEVRYIDNKKFETEYGVYYRIK
jgi:hypothetical protein